MVNTIIYKLLDTTSFNLRLNEVVPKLAEISDVLTYNNLPFETWYPDGPLSLQILEMSFSLNCKFQDVYLLAYFFKDFGLKTVYLSRTQENDICIGTYLHQIPDVHKYAMAEPMDIDKFLSLNPILNIQVIFNSYFENHFFYDESEDDENGEDESSDHFDYERATFDALTDGQAGDYDDWIDDGGDFDSLRDGMGY